MPNQGAKIPKPRPILEVLAEQAVEIPAVKPGVLLVLQMAPEGRVELAFIYKRTYTFGHKRPTTPADVQEPFDPRQTLTFNPKWPCKTADVQEPLDPKGGLYDDTPKGVIPSYRAVPEDVGFKTGTDLVVQASACPPGPVRQMQVTVALGNHMHAAEVIGKRHCDFVSGRLRFTDPEPFTDMPLRYENAYGGRDAAAEKAFGEDFNNNTAPEVLRRARPSIATFQLKEANPFSYIRNRSGKGYVVDGRPEWIQGRELPNLERPDDRLTPERLVVAEMMTRWIDQPIPVGFDYLDPLGFPRAALFGLAFHEPVPADKVPEVVKGLIPANFSRGNILLTADRDIPSLIHPDVARCASLGLRLPFFKGSEIIRLNGMDPAVPAFWLELPGERPRFRATLWGKEISDVSAQLYTAVVRMKPRQLLLTWCARARVARQLLDDEVAGLAASLRVEMTRS